METIHVEDSISRDNAIEHLLLIEDLMRLVDNHELQKLNTSDIEDSPQTIPRAPLYPTTEEEEVTQIPLPLPYLLLPHELEQETKEERRARKERRTYQLVQIASWLLSLTLLGLLGLAVVLPCILLENQEKSTSSTLFSVSEQMVQGLQPETDPSLLMSIGTSSFLTQQPVLFTFILGENDFPTLGEWFCQNMGQGNTERLEVLHTVQKNNPQINWTQAHYFHGGQTINYSCQVTQQDMRTAHRLFTKLKRSKKHQGGPVRNT
jgi:hypothetical protein